MRVVELFAGVGGFRIGFEESGSFDVIWANQWEPGTKVQHAANVYVERWGLSQTEDCGVFEGGDGDVFVNKDIATIEASIVPDHDLLCGGFPCQDYSVAKSLPTAKGIAGKKGVLWWEILRILEGKRPKYALLENVDRLLKSPKEQRGRDFAVMLSSLSKLGYSVEWRVVNSSDYGFPQRRKRVFLLAELAGNWGEAKEHLESRGVMAKAFPILELSSLVEFDLGRGDLSDISKNFNSIEEGKETPFGNCGVMIDSEVWTGKCKANYSGDMSSLGDILQNPGDIPDHYVLEPESLIREKGWIYLKGAKKEMRDGTDGFTYRYSEGPVTFPDALDRASRTIVTGEGGKSPSRFKHVVKFKPTKGQTERLKLRDGECNNVREKMGLGKTQWLRRLTPVELERLNGFPDNHTEGVSDGRRAFFMGNALVTGVVSLIAGAILDNP